MKKQKIQIILHTVKSILLNYSFWWVLTKILTYLATNDLEHLFTCLLANYIFSSMKYVFKNCPYLLLNRLSYYRAVWVVKHFNYKSYQIHASQMFFPFLWLGFSFSWKCLKSRRFKFWRGQSEQVFQKYLLVLWQSCLKTLCLPQGLKIFSSVFSSRNLIILVFMFTYMIHFMLIFVSGVKQRPRFALFHVYVQLFQHRLLKRLYFPHGITLTPS